MGDMLRSPGYRSSQGNYSNKWSDNPEPRYRRNLEKFVQTFNATTEIENEISHFMESMLNSFPYRIWPGSTAWEWSSVEIDDYVAPTLLNGWINKFCEGNQEGMELIMKIEKAIFEGPFPENDFKREYYILFGREISSSDFRVEFKKGTEEQKRVLAHMFPSSYERMNWEDEDERLSQALLEKGCISEKELLHTTRVKEYWLNSWKKQGLIRPEPTMYHGEFFPREEVQKILVLCSENKKKYTEKDKKS